MKKIYALIGLLVLIFIMMVFAESNKKKPIDWTETYDLNDKIPYGMYVFNEESDALFKNQNLVKFGKTPYEFLNQDNPNKDLDNYQDKEDYNQTNSDEYYVEDSIQAIYDSAYAAESYEKIEDDYSYDSYENQQSDFDYSKKGLLFIVHQQIDKTSANEMLKYVKQGNEVFISDEYISKVFLDSLQVKTKQIDVKDNLSKSKLINSKETFAFNKQYQSVYFDSINPKSTKVLGYYNLEYKLANFVKIKYGKGNFYLHLNPISFTNYNLLNKQNYRYTEKLMSFITNKNIYWFAKEVVTDDEKVGLLKFIAKNPALIIAWRLLLIGILIYILFNSKRRQRIIPIIEPERNLSVDFTKSIGNLYFQERNHNDIIEKMITYFFEKVRTNYHIDTSNLDEGFIKKLAHKTNNSEEDVRKLIDKIKSYKLSPFVNEKDVVELNKLLEKLNF